MPNLVKIDEVDASTLDLVFTALPHGTTQTVIKDLFEKNPKLKIVDVSADFRLSDPVVYEKWYGPRPSGGRTAEGSRLRRHELYRDEIKKARLVANPGCFTTTSILAIVPLLEAGAIEPDSIVIDSKTA